VRERTFGRLENVGAQSCCALFADAVCPGRNHTAPVQPEKLSFAISSLMPPKGEPLMNTNPEFRDYPEL
jgi:hypothetical protein